MTHMNENDHAASTPPRHPAARAAGLALSVVAGLALFARLAANRVERRVPADGRFIEIDGRRMHYLERGTGPAIVMIHGLGGQMRNFGYALLDRLSADHRVILIDRPGSGYSAPIAQANIRAQAAHVAAFITAMGLDRPLVVGHSLGGAIALALALDHPQQVGGLALIAPLTQPLATVPQIVATRAIGTRAMRSALAWTVATPAALLARPSGARMVFAPDPVPDDFATRGGGALIGRPSAFAGAAADLAAANANLPAMVARYPSLSVPTAILFGRDDAVLDPLAHGRGLANACPAAALTLVAGGHMIPVTRPDDVAAWLSTLTKPGAPV
ncbi:alpha/beta fold hydrolase [Sphingomonas sp. CFBP 13706]|uniref:alpha/beta fold hydrolase n=1 Tax=Sphingomonas sp. CFBP 13706 TaxID=2775314 RepID=UPI001FD2BB1E|nr:alpha/beta fold hydrolase [Sphingomonas sp. CFBP 13706]